ncbi:GNAT family N-acetyltransferase [Microbulbifer hydrolyticus]|uniref:GNAT family N-acetyltransferase n=1 Tax=Microbulbifer hydrolyticus TaxID=48074 RepID=A0A6P1TDC1_9GAMM|nr:GNAT family N-acetyltransferase [Microbulbifer hydrolyticus]MBB5211969.1 GNAT superfamily N-acetyltransferase [Microbulbifer hydrolyticus]QHQ39653.1 GNAT family N-acetyltransferase [Microbulbifer hydrolyticus]
MAIVIRPATPADIQVLIPLIAEHAAYEADHFSQNTEFAERLEEAAFGAQPRVQLWLALDAEYLLGYAATTREFSTWSAAEYLHLDCLYLRETRRGEGIGRQLINATVDYARQRGLKEMQWQTPEWNHRAIEFYRSLGAQALEKQRFYLEV